MAKSQTPPGLGALGSERPKWNILRRVSRSFAQEVRAYALGEQRPDTASADLAGHAIELGSADLRCVLKKDTIRCLASCADASW